MNKSVSHAPIRAFALAAGLAFVPAPAPAEPFVMHVAETTVPDPAGDVLDVAAATGQFEIFLAAVEAAGMQETLRGEGPFTVFAPTDTAFEALGDAEVRRLMQPAAHEELMALIAYHVVAERLTSASIDGQVVREEATSGYRLTLDGRDGLRVNDELVVIPDVSAGNGVIQGINAVLAPPVMVAAR